MGSLGHVSQPSICTMKVDKQKTQRTAAQPQLVKSSSPRSFSASNAKHYSEHNSLTPKAGPNFSCPNLSSYNSLICGRSSSFVPRSSNTVESSDIYIENSMVEKSEKRNSKRKGRKKRKQRRKSSCDTGSTEPEVLSCASGISFSAVCANKSIDHEDDLVALSSDFRMNENDYGGIDATVVCYPKLKTCTSCSDIKVSRFFPCLDEKLNEHPIIGFGNRVQYNDLDISNFIGAIDSNHCHYSCCEDLAEMHDLAVLNSVMCSNCDNSANTLADTRKEVGGITEPAGFRFKKSYFPHQNSSINFIDSISNAEKAKCYNHEYNSSSIQLVATGESGKKFKTVARNPNVCRLSNASTYAYTGKENNQSVWQKVQRRDPGEKNHGWETVRPISSDPDITSKAALMLKRGCCAVDLNMLSTSVDKRKFKAKVSRRLKRKSVSGWRQVYDSYSKRVSPAPHTSSIAGLKGNLMQKRRLEMPAHTRARYVGRSEHTNKTSSTIGNFVDQSQPHFPLITKNVTGTQINLSERRKQDHGSGCIMQKWIPVGLKVAASRGSSISDCSSLVLSDETACEGWMPKNVTEEELRVSNVIPSSNGNLTGFDGTVISNSQHHNYTQKLNHPGAYSRVQQKAAANCLSHGLRDKTCFASEIDLKKIAEAASEACRLQLKAEAVQKATGSQIAEIEILLYSVSPIICQSGNDICCEISHNQFFGKSLCRHKLPNIPLGSLWKWYEKHGSYGLEVMVGDYENSRRLGVDQSTFRAYFVPFLSAIQLFRGREISANNRKSVPISKILETSELGETSDNSSDVSGIPIFSIVVLGEPNSEVSLEICKEDAPVQSAHTTLDDIELLYQYFEADLPQQRCPLYEKIKELVSGKRSQCKENGDPTILASINLPDLHPTSWYSVAWYPIYRIPDGNFRAAFLTYHSLGHFIHRDAKLGSSCLDSCIVAPVVGLQSYNAQNECWFDPRPVELDQAARHPSLNPNAILEERLRTLELTASLMARCTVRKGNLTGANRHPDFEFFLSRHR